MNKYHNRCLTAFIIFSLLMIIDCGYYFGPGGENIDKNIRKVFVENFQNNTSQAHLETYLRKAFIDELIKTNKFKPADGRDSADAILKGKIKTYTLSPHAYRTNNIAAIEQINITMEIFLQERNTQKIIWSDNNFSGSQDYDIDTLNLSITENARKNALVKLSKDTAERAFRSIMSGF